MVFPGVSAPTAVDPTLLIGGLIFAVAVAYLLGKQRGPAAAKAKGKREAIQKKIDKLREDLRRLE
ncbi:MAG: hypothetical protein LAN62_02130 [Acidobacteriia bacterium]|nr:hypothetical protein [Terriglobia bacterium]